MQEKMLVLWNLMISIIRRPELIKNAMEYLESGDFELCLYDSPVTYSTPLELGTTYLWEVTDGNIISGQYSNSISVDWFQPVIGIVKVSQTLLSTGCNQSDEKNVFVYDVPDINFNINDTTLCPVTDTILLYPEFYPDSSTVLWTCTDIGNQWHNYTGDTVQIYSTGVGFYSATYYLNITTEHGCSDSDSVNIVFDFEECNNGICDYKKNNIVQIYPNPVHNYLYFEFLNQDILPIQMAIFDKLSNKIFESFISTPISNIDISDFNSGIYLLRFTKNELVYTAKFMKL